MHPYIGIPCTVPAAKYFPAISGIIVWVGDIGSSDDRIDVYATIRLADGSHANATLSSVLVNPADMPKKIVSWQTDTTSGAAPTRAPDDGTVPLGPWEPIGCGIENGRINGGIGDMETVFCWRRPLAIV